MGSPCPGGSGTNALAYVDGTSKESTHLLNFLQVYGGMALASAALLLKQQRVLAEACAEEQNVARDALSHCLEKLQRVSRQHRNLQHALERLRATR